MTYKFLEHESDLYIEGCGKSLFDAMNEIGKGVVETLSERERNKGSNKTKKSLKLVISGNPNDDDDGYNEKSFVVNVFSEIISEIETEVIQPNRITISKSKIPSSTLTADILIEGYAETPANIIKAVTWHNLEIKKSELENEKKVCVRILFDI